MTRTAVFCLLLSFGCRAATSSAQTITFRSSSMPVGEALDQALNNNVLTHSGTPFHAVLNFKPKEPDVDRNISGTVELFWYAPQHYHLQLTSPAFAQTLIVDGDRVQETDRGDFFPIWLQNFATALLDPMPRLGQIRQQPNDVRGGAVGQGYFAEPCIGRNDKTRNVTDPLTWALVCFNDDGPQLNNVLDLVYNMSFSDFRNFHGKRIAHGYSTSTGSNDPILGTLTTLEDWTPNPALRNVTSPTPAKDRILTQLVSTQQEESMVEVTPKNIQWPKVHEGPFDGYMIVQAVTDRNGQVRESSKHNSDNAMLEAFGRDVAVRYKFHPLLVDGAPQQMIMPLVLHFTTTIDQPIPELDDHTSRKLISGCSLPHDIADPASAGQNIEIIISVDEDGHFSTAGSSDRKISPLIFFRMFQGCHFAVYKDQGKPVPYHAHVAVKAK